MKLEEIRDKWLSGEIATPDTFSDLCNAGASLTLANELLDLWCKDDAEQCQSQT